MTSIMHIAYALTQESLQHEMLYAGKKAIIRNVSLNLFTVRTVVTSNRAFAHFNFIHSK